MVYFPDAELRDGAAELVTRGFFDVYNTPPWDTWVAWLVDTPAGRPTGYEGYALAYVPARLVGLAQEGISVNPEQCIAWLADSDTALSRRLRAL